MRKAFTYLIIIPASIIFSCTKEEVNNTPAPPPPPPIPPAISSFSPVTATVGSTVIITGTNFNGATTVSFGGVPALSFNIGSPTSISAVVPGQSTGSISVTTPAGTSSLNGFIYQTTTVQFQSPGTPNFTIPQGITKIKVELTGPGGWGGGGTGIGGKGGLVSGDLVVTPAESLSLLMAQGSTGSNVPQYTSIKRGNTILALAAGGGNGSSNGGRGGNAGNPGTSGTLGSSALLSGGAGSGATINAGGIGGPGGSGSGSMKGSNGTALSGGSNNDGKEGWGGSGWFGGGASGTYNYLFSIGGPFASGGGGGGSNYTNGLTGTITNNSNGSAGGSGNGNGANGKIVIVY